MSVDRTTIKRSPAKFTFGGATFYPREAVEVDYSPEFDRIVAAIHGRIDDSKKDVKIPVRARLWGAYENLSVLFPSTVLTPTMGLSLCADSALVITAKNNDRLTLHNAFLTKLTNLYLGIDKDVWAADVEFMALIKSGANPEDAAAYYTRDTTSYADTTFAKTNFIRQRYSLAWGSKTGFTSFEMREGVNVSWTLDVQYDYSSNYGTDNAYIGEGGLIGEVTGIPAGPTLAQQDTQSRTQGSNLGALGGANSADLVVTGPSGASITLKNAFMFKHSEAFDIKKLRAQEIGFRTTTAFSAGTAAAIGVVA